MKKFISNLILILVVCFIFSGCATRQAAEIGEVKTTSRAGTISQSKSFKTTKDSLEVPVEDELGSFSEHRTHVFDPLEPINRAIFAFNHEFYRFVIRPVADGYEFILPKIVREGIDNVYENLTFPVRFVNHGLQGRFDRAGKELGAFVVNSVAGIGGVWHPSEKIEFLKDIPKADTGQTFAKWGIGHGPYLVLPVLGPTTVRDFVGMVGDYALNPVSWATFAFGGEVWTLAITSPNTVRTLPKRMDEYDAATKHAIDRYTSARMTYIHFRNKHAKR